jgi:hypothetical protein
MYKTFNILVKFKGVIVRILMILRIFKYTFYFKKIKNDNFYQDFKMIKSIFK